MTSPSSGKAVLGKVVLITGATDGLGKAAAILLAERGYRVYAAGRSPEKRAQLDQLAQTQNLPMKSLELDVTSDDSVRGAVGQVLSEGRAIDVLINNAGLGYMAVVEELKMEDMRKQFETNVFGVLRVTQAILPHMRERRSGRILMTSSVAGLVSPPTYGAYSSGKPQPNSPSPISTPQRAVPTQKFIPARGAERTKAAATPKPLRKIALA